MFIIVHSRIPLVHFLSHELTITDLAIWHITRSATPDVCAPLVQLLVIFSQGSHSWWKASDSIHQEASERPEMR